MNNKLQEFINLSEKKHLVFYSDNEEMSLYNEIMEKMNSLEKEITNDEFLNIIEENIFDWVKLDIIGVLKISRKIVTPIIDDCLSELCKSKDKFTKIYAMIYKNMKV